MKDYQGLRRDADSSYHIFLSSGTGFWTDPSSPCTTEMSSLDELGIDWFNMKVILV